MLLLAALVAAALPGCDIFIPNTPPTVVLTTSATCGPAPLVVRFDASQSYDPEGQTINFSWDFGDGDTDSGAVVEHTFGVPAIYVVQVSVNDDRGASTAGSVQVVASVETTQTSIGSQGGTATTTRQSSATASPGLFSTPVLVTVSELAKTSIQFAPSVVPLGNGIAVELSASPTDPKARTALGEIDAGDDSSLTLTIPVAAQAGGSLDGYQEGLFLRFVSGEDSVEMVTGMNRDGGVAEIVLPGPFLELVLNELSENSTVSAMSLQRQLELAAVVSKPTDGLAATPRLLRFINPRRLMVIAIPYSVLVEHIDSELYSVVSGSYKSVGRISGSAVESTWQSADIVPVILVHGYKIARSDEIYVADAVPASIRPSAEEHSPVDYIRSTWDTFIGWLNGSGGNAVRQACPQGCRVQLYAYRWDTDEGLSSAGANLATLITKCFGTRPYILVGHSAGGLVARSCVEENEEAGANAAGMIALASPHLGVPAAALIGFDWTGFQLEGLVNPWLSELNRNANHNNKLIVYGGYILTPFGHALKLGFGWSVSLSVLNDGVVPLDSAMAEGLLGVRARRGPYLDYDHEEMLKGKAGTNSALYRDVCSDLAMLVPEAISLPCELSLQKPADVELPATAANTPQVVACTYEIQMGRYDYVATFSVLPSADVVCRDYTPSGGTNTSTQRGSVDLEYVAPPPGATATITIQGQMGPDCVGRSSMASKTTSFNVTVAGRDQPTQSVTVTLYLHDGSLSGPVLSGATVTGCDGVGKTFNQTTNSSGYVTLTGQAGTWSFTASKSGYDSNSWSESITADTTQDKYLLSGPKSLSFTGLTPPTITTSSSTYQATLQLTGSNFLNVNRVSYSWSGADSGSVIWNQGDSNWNAAVVVGSDGSMTLRPVVLSNETSSQTKTWTWTVTLRDSSGATAYRSFTVTYNPPAPPTPTLSLTGLTPPTITTSSSTYQATLQLTGSNFLNVNRVSYSWTGPDSGSMTWNQGDSNWNSAVTVGSDGSMTLRPVVLSNETSSQSKTWIWTVTLRDNTGATASRPFTVTYNPPTPPVPTLAFTGLSPSTIVTSNSTHWAMLQLTGTNFLNVNQVRFSWSGADSGSATWNQGDTNWNSAVTVGSDGSMTLAPKVISNETSSQSKMWNWTVTLRDNSGATASRSFTVTYNP
ncbi:MAG: PKD domain-containing protein [Candidatus Bipolaricaulota bacterium]|nr:PKD domain-containing protein [Candidatus Bipolaricaulota bacterium]